MNSPDQTPKLPMWIFFVSDAALLIAAWFIADRGARPLSTGATFAIFGCIFGGALILLVPLIARYERQKNETLDERQRQLESLSRTISASAEQISIATSGLHEVTELAQKTLKHAEQLQQKLHERIAEFHAGIATASDTEKEEMAKELEALRESESERLQTIADKVAKSAAEWSKLEAATNQHLAAATDAIAKLSFGTASAIGKAQAAAEQALAQARVEASRTFGEASGTATKAIEAAKAAAIAEIETKVATARPAVAAPAPEKPKVIVEPAAPPPPSPESPSAPSAGVEEAAKPARPRKSRPVEPAPGEAAAPIDSGIVITAPEPQPVLAQKISEVAPVAPQTAEPFLATAGVATATVEHQTNGHSTPATPKPARKRSPKPAAAESPALDANDKAADGEAEGIRSGVVERVLSSDGATRLLVTAYIGIGNRLFIRGDGPGLSWDKGVPLQFVSIGKWRWETNDAAGPVKFKLFKNDDLECATLGSQSLDPGQQQEVTAAF